MKLQSALAFSLLSLSLLNARERHLRPAKAALGEVPPPPLAVSVAFADTRTASAEFPTPWISSDGNTFPNLMYIGMGLGKKYAAGGILLVNPGEKTVHVDRVFVSLERPGPLFDLWGNFNIQPHQFVILTQTATGNFDTSNSPIAKCFENIRGGDPRIPKVTLRISGVSYFFLDRSHVLDAGGFSCPGNHSAKWKLLYRPPTKEEENNPAAIPNYQQVKPASAMTLASLRNPIVSALPNAMQSAAMPGQPTPTPLVNGTITYSYDAVGNQTQVVSTVPQIPSSGMMFYDANDRLSTDSYDNNGNTINSGGIQDVYDFEGHLIKHGNVEMVYDADGNRIAKTVAGVTTSYLVDDSNPSGYPQVLEEQQAGNVVRRYTYGLNLISQNQQINNSWTPSWYLFDGHSGVRGLTDSSGLLTDQYMYNGYGNLLATNGATPNLYLYRGQQFDPDLNLYYNRARYLDVRRARFWSMDTEDGSDDDPISLHKYLYASANPINEFDPSGNDAIAEVTTAMDMSMTLDNMSDIHYYMYRNGGGKNVQITIDDAPGTSTADMLNLLRQYDIHTMFFVEGTFAAARPGSLQEILSAGQKIGNHTWDHPQLVTLSDLGVQSELMRTENIVKRLTGHSLKPNWRPPYGSTSARVQAAASRVGFSKQWLWEVDSLDWKYRSNVQAIRDQVERELAMCHKATCDILFHDKTTTVNALRTLIPALKIEGYRFVDFP